MTAVDTNILIRLLTKDDITQYEKAYQIFATNQIWIPHTVLLETEWVLRFTYKFDRLAINKALRNVLTLENVDIPDEWLIDMALNWHQSGLDFADALHLASSQMCSSFVTFDEKLIQKSPKDIRTQVIIP